jgi:hypothetical protein
MEEQWRTTKLENDIILKLGKFDDALKSLWVIRGTPPQFSA